MNKYFEVNEHSHAEEQVTEYSELHYCAHLRDMVAQNRCRQTCTSE